MMTKQVEEILDEPHERIVQRVCAVDVGKDSGTVCVRVPAASGTGRRVSKVWDVPARTGAVLGLAAQLSDQGIEKVTLESTSDYWRIWFYLLEAHGLDVQLAPILDIDLDPVKQRLVLDSGSRAGVHVGQAVIDAGGLMGQVIAVTPAHSTVLLLTGDAQRFVFDGVAERPVPSLLRDFSAPVILDYAYGDDELALLLAHDRDPFNRWEAGQRLFARLIGAACGGIQLGAGGLPGGVIGAGQIGRAHV
mgnify:CR=1 FL=1